MADNNISEVYVPTKGTCCHCKCEQTDITRGGQWINDKWLCTDCIELPSKDTNIYLTCRYCGNPKVECSTRICDTCDVKTNLIKMKFNGMKSASLLIENQSKLIKNQNLLIENLEAKLRLAEIKTSYSEFEHRMEVQKHEDIMNTMDQMARMRKFR